MLGIRLHEMGAYRARGALKDEIAVGAHIGLFKPFMRRAVINRLLAHIGSKRRMRDAEFDVAYTERAPFDISELLPDREMADVVRLCWIEDYSMRQAAGILHLKRRRVKYVLKKAKQRLQGIYDGN